MGTTPYSLHGLRGSRQGDAALWQPTAVCGEGRARWEKGAWGGAACPHPTPQWGKRGLRGIP